MQDFHDVYVKLDVVLLADCMENFRRVGMQEYGITWHMAMLLKYDKFRIAADNRSERFSHVQKCDKRWCIDH